MWSVLSNFPTIADPSSGIRPILDVRSPLRLGAWCRLS